MEIVNMILIMRPTHPVAKIITEYFTSLETSRRNHEMIERSLETEFDDFEGNWWQINQDSDSDSVYTDTDNNSEYEYEDI